MNLGETRSVTSNRIGEPARRDKDLRACSVNFGDTVPQSIFDNLLSCRPARAVRYPFLTSKERDNETGLDYFGARYYANTQGRFTSSDPMMASAKLSNGGQTHTEREPAGEFLATGLPFDYKGSKNIPKRWDITENRLRKELMKTPRVRATYK